MMSSAIRRRFPALLKSSLGSSKASSYAAAAIVHQRYHSISHKDVTHGATRWVSSDQPPINVTITQTEPNNDNETPKAGLSKTPDQITEEQILSLQSELRTHHRSANYTAALSTASTLLDMSLEHFGKLHPATASAYNNVGLMNKCLGHYVMAKEAYEESLRIYGEVCGKDHGSYAAALSNLGVLERVRVMEVDDDDDDEDSDRNDSMVTQEKFDDDYNTPLSQKEKAKLTTLDRLQLNEVAIEYFDEAYRIRLAELGSTHPHTIASRSQLGSAMAYSVIMERRNKLSSAAGKGGLIEKELRNMKHQLSVKNEEEMERHIPLAVARAASKSMESSSKLSRRRWDAAQEHLRGALETAVGDPRGESVRPLEYLPGTGSGIASTTDKGSYVKDRSLPKKERKKAAKEAKREKRQANANALQSNTDTTNTVVAIQGAACKVTTLSAATAAQNLAVFLKNYADWQQLSLLDDTSKTNSEQQLELQYQKEQQLLHLKQNLQEARHLYEAALHVRSQLLPAHHPDVVATKFSLAELLDDPKEGVLAGLSRGVERDSVRANALREEILSAYNVEEVDEETSSAASN